jgi:hypothetical protein
MLVKDILELAKSTELKKLAIKDDDNTIISYINLGILELYKRFPIKQEEAIVTLQEGKTKYLLDGTDSNVDIDTTNNFLIVSSCYDEDGDEITINDHTDPLGVMTPSHNILEVPNVAQGERLSVVYRCSPGFVYCKNDVLPLPIQLVSCLLQYIGYKGHSTISSSIKDENNSYYLRFQDCCDKAEKDGVIPFDDMVNTAFYSRGFV